MSDIDEPDQSSKIKSSSQDAEFGLLKKQLIRKLSIKHAERKLIVSSIPLDTSEQEIYTHSFPPLSKPSGQHQTLSPPAPYQTTRLTPLSSSKSKRTERLAFFSTELSLEIAD